MSHTQTIVYVVWLDCYENKFTEQYYLYNVEKSQNIKFKIVWDFAFALDTMSND